jgi:beta-glucanase (GH16 family)
MGQRLIGVLVTGALALIGLCAPRADSNPVTFYQDFSGPAGANADYGLDEPMWTTDACWSDAPACSGTLAQYDDGHARLDGAGSLVLTADRDPSPGATCPPVPCEFASARLATVAQGAERGRPLWSQAGGHIEARLMLPAGQGIWPAFWLVGDEYTGRWPLTGEIDVLETLGDQPTVVQQHVHGGSPDVNAGGAYSLPTGDITGWHTYAVDWDAGADGHVRWSVDGVVTRTLTAADLGPAWASLRGPESLVLDLAVGGDWPGPPDASTPFPARMLVDYVLARRDPLR